MALPEYRWVSVGEYLAIDSASDVRFEYVHGQLRMLAGGSRNHALIAHNLHALLHNRLLGTPWATYTSDMRVQVAVDRYYYPDVTVSCDENEAEIYGPGNTVRIESLNAEFLMDEVYERIHFKQ